MTLDYVTRSAMLYLSHTFVHCSLLPLLVIPLLLLLAHTLRGLAGEALVARLGLGA